jgi:hypothetical protein
MLVGIAIPAWAAQFFVVQSVTSKTCQLQKAKPDGTSMVMVGDLAYSTKEEAKAALKSAIETGQCAKGGKD